MNNCTKVDSVKIYVNSMVAMFRVCHLVPDVHCSSERVSDGYLSLENQLGPLELSNKRLSQLFFYLVIFHSYSLKVSPHRLVQTGF